MTIRLQARRFVCAQPTCPSAFLPSVCPPWLRPIATGLTDSSITTLGFALGGRAGARFAQGGGSPISRGQFLTDVRTYPLLVSPEPRIISVDDWALAKGQTYGTIILDLETHQPLNLPPIAAPRPSPHGLVPIRV